MSVGLGSWFWLKTIIQARVGSSGTKGSRCEGLPLRFVISTNSYYEVFGECLSDLGGCSIGILAKNGQAGNACKSCLRAMSKI